MTKYNDLLREGDVRRWHDNLAASSPITAEVYLRGLGLYCELNDATPKKILQGAKRKGFRDSFIDFVRRLEKEGKAGSYISRFKKVLASWLSYNGVDVKLKVNIRGAMDTPTIANERVPTKEELAKILRKASARGRVAIAMMAFSGLRPGSLGDYLGKDGIRLGDFRETKITSSGMEFEKVPAQVAVRKNLSKGRFQYFTFIPEETVTYVKEYIEGRVKAGERFSPESPLLQFDPRGNKKNQLLRTALVTRDIREAIRGAGFDWRPYVLRSYCDTAFDIGESKGLISHPWRQFFMGHKGDIEARYSTNKGRLPPNMIEEMREAYKRCVPLLSTQKQEGVSEENLKQSLREQLLLVANFKKEEIDRMDLGSMTDEEFQSTVRQKLLGAMANNGARQKPIAVNELDDHLSRGWEFVSTLPDSRVLMKLPS